MKFANTELINDFISIMDEFQLAKDVAAARGVWESLIKKRSHANLLNTCYGVD